MSLGGCPFDAAKGGARGAPLIIGTPLPSCTAPGPKAPLR